VRLIAPGLSGRSLPPTPLSGVGVVFWARRL
jgi:hypothetical protein